MHALLLHEKALESIRSHVELNQILRIGIQRLGLVIDTASAAGTFLEVQPDNGRADSLFDCFHNLCGYECR